MLLANVGLAGLVVAMVTVNELYKDTWLSNKGSDIVFHRQHFFDAPPGYPQELGNMSLIGHSVVGRLSERELK